MESKRARHNLGSKQQKKIRAQFPLGVMKNALIQIVVVVKSIHLLKTIKLYMPHECILWYVNNY